MIRRWLRSEYEMGGAASLWFIGLMVANAIGWPIVALMEVYDL